MSDWSEWVLDHGLPPLPESLADGELVPIARWAGARFGAVLHVTRYWDEEDGEDRLDSEIEVFRRTEAGWESSDGGGGAGWFDPPFERPGLASTEVIGGHEHGSGGPAWSCCSVDGVAGEDAAWVEVLDAAGVERQPIESPFGAFIACSDGRQRATVRILDAAEAVLLSWTFGGHFAEDGLSARFGGLADFDQGADPPSDEIGIIQVTSRAATGDEMRELLLSAAEGPSGLPPSIRAEIQVRLQRGDDPAAIAEWLMTIPQHRGQGDPT